MEKPSKKLTSRDVVLGIGRTATDKELNGYLHRDRKESFKPLAQVREEITAHISARNQKKKAS
jgi:hypothetical protein